MIARRRLALLVPAALVAAGCGSAAQQAPSAAEQVPRLGIVLDRVDRDLSAHHYGAARQDLRSLKAAVTKARDAGQLRDADAARVLAAVERLIGRLPAATATSGPTATATSASSRPSASASTKPAHPRTTTQAPPASPTATGSPTAAPTSASASPTSATSSASTQVSPAAVTSSATP